MGYQFYDQQFNNSQYPQQPCNEDNFQYNQQFSDCNSNVYQNTYMNNQYTGYDSNMSASQTGFIPDVSMQQTRYIPNVNMQQTGYIPNINMQQAGYIPNINMQQTDYIPNIQSQQTGFIPDFMEQLTGNLPNIQNQQTEYIPNIQASQTGYIPDMQIIQAQCTATLPPISNQLTGYIPEAQILQAQCTSMIPDLPNQYTGYLPDVQTVSAQCTSQIPVEMVNNQIQTTDYLNNDENNDLFSKLSYFLTTRGLKKVSDKRKSRKLLSFKVKMALSIMILPVFMLFLPKLTFGFAPSIWLTVSNSDSEFLQVISQYVENTPLLAPAAVATKKQATSNEDSAPSTVKGLNAHQLMVAEKLISLFENGTTKIQYAYAENIGDGVGITCGRAGFCTGTGDALEVIKRYTKKVPDNRLSKYINELTKINNGQKSKSSTSGILAIGNYYSDWKKCADDKIFRQVQDDVVHDFYYTPAKEKCDSIGATLPFTKAVLYDTALHHGAGGMQKIATQTTNALGGTPKSGVSEKKWIKKFLDIRRNRLANSNFPSCVYRIDVFYEIYNAENFDLSKKITIKQKNFKGTVIE